MCERIGGALVMLAGPERKILVRGKVYLFEMHSYMGPCLLRADGEPRANQFSKGNNAFWEAVSWWAQQGERIGPDGMCVYDEPEAS